MDAQRFIALAVALSVGFIIGLQREQSAAREGTPDRSFPGGVRTYPLVALAGALSVLLASRFGGWLVAAGFLSFLIPLGLAYADDLRRNLDRGITSETALIVTYFLGCLSTADGVGGSLKERLLLCTSMGVAVTALLSFKDPLHALASRISRDDLYAAVKFGLLGAVVLPLLPDKDYGPYGALNPAKIGLFVVLVAGLSFAGYVAVRVLGAGKGLGITGLLGGLVSSTAIAFSFAARAKREPASSQACALGIILASTIMGLRVIGLVAVTNRPLLPIVAVPVGALTLGGVIAGGVFYLRSRKEVLRAESVEFSNPFELSSALKFGLIFGLVLLGSKAAIQLWGRQGSYAAALLAGGVDVDAISLSLSRLPPAELPLKEAALSITLACASNSVVKAAISIALGGWAFGWRVLLAFLGMITAGAAGVLVLALRS